MMRRKHSGCEIMSGLGCLLFDNPSFNHGDVGGAVYGLEPLPQDSAMLG